MNCYKCKHPNLHGSNFCEKCGADLKNPPPVSNPVMPYSGYQPPSHGYGQPTQGYGQPTHGYPPSHGYGSPSGYGPPARPTAAPKPTPAPRPAPAGSGYSPPPQAPPPPAEPPRRAAPPPQAAPPSQAPKQRRRSPILSEPQGQSEASVPPPTPRREPLPFGRLSSDSGLEFPLRYDVNLIGRTSDGITPQVDLGSADSKGTVSRRHARIGKDDSSIFIEDLGSSNGTRHNGQPLREGMQAPLNDGDQIVFGDLAFTFHLT